MNRFTWNAADCIYCLCRLASPTDRAKDRGRSRIFARRIRRQPMSLPDGARPRISRTKVAHERRPSPAATLTLALAVGAITIAIASTAGAQNLLRNPGFESVPSNAMGQGLVPGEWELTSSSPDTYSEDPDKSPIRAVFSPPGRQLSEMYLSAVPKTLLVLPTHLLRPPPRSTRRARALRRARKVR